MAYIDRVKEKARDSIVSCVTNDGRHPLDIYIFYVGTQVIHIEYRPGLW